MSYIDFEENFKMNKEEKNELFENICAIIGAGVVIAFTISFLALFFALPFMLLWNWLMPAIFGLIKITFWQALGLNMLCGIAFRSKFSKSQKSEK